MRRSLVFATLAITAPALAQDGPITEEMDTPTVESYSAAADDGGVRFTLTADGVYQFEADVDDGGAVSISTFDADLAVELDLSESLTLSFGVEYGLDAYDFTGSTGVGGLDPWGDIYRTRLSTSMRYRIDDNWMLAVGGFVRWDRENGASWSDSFTGGGIVGLSYAFNRDLILGVGIGVASQIEDDARFFPGLTLHWQITEQLHLESRVTVGWNNTGGLQLFYDFNDEWSVGAGVFYIRSRFRLDDSGVAVNGVGEYEQLPVVLFATWKPSKIVELSVYAGVSTIGKLTLDNSTGSRISREDVDTTPLIGVRARIRF